MPSLPARCQKCGYEFKTRLIAMAPGATTTFNNVGESCPRPGCGGIGKIPDGTYSTIGRVLEAVRAPGVEREDVVAFQSIVDAFRAGQLPKDKAEEKVNDIGYSFEKLWSWLNANPAFLGLVAIILTIIIPLYFGEHSDEASAQAHTDALHEIEAFDKIAQVLQNSPKAAQTNYEARSKQRLSAPSPEAISLPKVRKRQTLRQKMQAMVKRQVHHERRKAAVWHRRLKARLSFKPHLN